MQAKQNFIISCIIAILSIIAAIASKEGWLKIILGISAVLELLRSIDAIIMNKKTNKTITRHEDSIIKHGSQIATIDEKVQELEDEHSSVEGETLKLAR